MYAWKFRFLYRKTLGEKGRSVIKIVLFNKFISQFIIEVNLS